MAELDRRPDVTRVSLAGLDRAAVAELLATERGLVSASSGWVAAVRAASGGNPLFIEELLATLPADSPVEPRELTDCVETPHGVAQLVATRLRRLAPTTVWWLDHAAIAGACFDFATATRASGLPEDQALDAVGEATAARLVTATGADDGYAFTHGVTRMALLTRLTPSRRLRLHARLTVALGAGQPDEATRAAHRLVHHRPGDQIRYSRSASSVGS